MPMATKNIGGHTEHMLKTTQETGIRLIKPFNRFLAVMPVSSFCIAVYEFCVFSLKNKYINPSAEIPPTIATDKQTAKEQPIIPNSVSTPIAASSLDANNARAKQFIVCL